MFDNKTPIQNLPDDSLNKEQAPASLAPTEDIFSNVENKQEGEIAKPIDFSKKINVPTETNDLPPEVNFAQGKSEKSNKILTIIIIVLAVVLVGLAGFWVYVQYMKPAPAEEVSFDNLPSNSGQNIGNVLEDLSKGLIQPQAKENISTTTSQVTEPEIPSDIDGDGLTDEEEIILGTNPGRVDTDFDGLSDYDEVKIYLTDPTDGDSDKDGYLDGVEIEKGYNPLGPGRLNPEENNTNDVILKKYTDNTHEFQFDYPSGWYYKKHADGEEVLVSFDQASSLSELNLDTFSHKFSISLVENKQNNTVDDWLETYYAGMEFADKNFINIDGYNAIQTQEAPTMGQSIFETHVQKGNKVYIFRLIGKNVDYINSQDKEYYNKIISSFKFLN